METLNPQRVNSSEVVVDLQAVRDRIVSTLHPRRIVVFGKGTRDETGADSDLRFFYETETDRRPPQRSDDLTALFGLRP